MSEKTMPSISLAQQDNSAIGILENSVNLFRGSVVYNQGLFSMPGRQKEDGLEINLSARYQSGPQKQAAARNADAPTGILGLGWEFGFGKISMDKSSGISQTAKRYYLELDGISTRLIREPSQLLFKMPVAKELKISSVLKYFRNNGLPLSERAELKAAAVGWQLSDDTFQQQYRLEKQRNEIHVYTGGESYQTENYKFWRILYYPAYERWTVTKENGLIVSFGGGVPLTSQNYKTSEGNSISWAVAWSNSNGKPAWQGSSMQDESQIQYAVAWNISRTYSKSGEYVSFAYNEFDRDKQHLLCEVEQLVSPKGKPYTKASYLTSVTDVYGRKVIFKYENKIWAGTKPQDIREYTDPHKCKPDNLPNGYQDCYETKYLSSIAVQPPEEGETLFEIKFEYEVKRLGETGDYHKRLLSGYTTEMPHGEQLTGHNYTYYDDVSTASNLGALKRVIWPTGGAVTYRYDKKELQTCQRLVAADIPKPLGSASRPGIWFGSDYAVIVWYDGDSEQLTVQAASWDGKWRIWQPGKDNALLGHIPGGIDMSTLDVLTADDFFAVHFETASTLRMNLFQKNPSRPACWEAVGDSAQKVGNCWEWLRSKGQVQFEVGESFLIAQQYDSAYETGERRVIYWNWQSQSWYVMNQPLDKPTVVKSYQNSYLTIDSRGIAKRFIYTAEQKWENTLESQLEIREDNPKRLQITLGDSMAVIVHNKSAERGAAKLLYDLFALRWNNDGMLISADAFMNRTDFNPNNSLRAALVQDSLLAVAGSLLRFDGMQWQEAQLSFENAPYRGIIHYGYGTDYAVAVRVDLGNPEAVFMCYLPEKGGWQKKVSIKPAVPQYHRDTAYEICAGEAYLTIGTLLFMRQPGESWQDAVALTKAVDLDKLASDTFGTPCQMNTASFSNQGADFLVGTMYEKAGDDTNTSVVVFNILNGKVQKPQRLQQEKIYTAAERIPPRRGLYPYGNHMFAGYPVTYNTFDNTGKIYLHQYAADSILGTVNDWPVCAIDINNGMGETYRTEYEPEIESASFSKGAFVVKYYRTVIYPGGSRKKLKHGSVEHTFLSTDSMEQQPELSYYHSMDGLPYRVVSRDEQGNDIFTTTNCWSAYRKKSLHPGRAEAGIRQIYGSYVLLKEKTEYQDKVEKREFYEYAPTSLTYTYHGQLTATIRKVLNLSGAFEKHVEATSYACEVYENGVHDLTSVSGGTNSVDGKVITAQAVRYAVMDLPGSSWRYAFLREAEFNLVSGSSIFPYHESQAGAPAPEGWACRSRVSSYHGTGQIAEMYGADDRVCATRYSQKYALPTASFNGVAVEQYLWNTFLSYDEQQWCTQGSYLPANQFGDRCLHLKKNETLDSPVLNGIKVKAYTAVIRYRSLAKTFEAELRINDGQRRELPAAAQWSCVTFRVNAGKPVSFSIICIQGEMEIDYTGMYPAETEVTAWYSNPQNNTALALMDTDGKVIRHLYDNALRQNGIIAPDGSLQEYSITTAGSRPAKDTAHSHDAVLSFANGGKVFYQNSWESWAEYLHPAQQEDWRVEGKYLSKIKRSKTSLTHKAASGQGARAAYFIEIAGIIGKQGEISCCFGQNERIYFQSGTGWKWEDGNGTCQSMPLIDISRCSRLLLVLGKGLVLFYANGHLIFSKASAAFTISDVIWQFDGEIKLSCAGVGYEPRMTAVYSDGAGNQRQIHELYENTALLQAWQYDGLGRVLALTKKAPCNAITRDMEPMWWNEKFFAAAAFMANYDKDPVMTGDIAAYYSGAAGRSDDEGYPYKGARYAKLKQDREVETGQPGKVRALRPLQDGKPSGKGSTRKKYYASIQSVHVPAGLAAEQITFPDGPVGVEYRDTLDRMVAAEQRSETGEILNISTSRHICAETLGSISQTYLPRYFEEHGESFVNQQFLDTFNNIIKWSDCDTGDTEFIYDYHKKVRFSRTAGDKEQFLYNKYDASGRLIEEGVLKQAWNYTRLVQQAVMQAYPAAADNPVIRRQYRYGTAGNESGKLIEIITINPPIAETAQMGNAVVTESWTYNDMGRVEHSRLHIEGIGKELFSAALTYHYNQLGEVMAIEYPEGAKVPRVSFTYNDLGEMEQITADQSNDAIASYQWSASGQLVTAVRGKVKDQWFRDSVENICTYEVRDDKGEELFRQNYGYSPGNRVEERQTILPGGGKEERIHEQFSYDGMSRLTEAKRNGAAGQMQYDANGNILTARSSGEELIVGLEPGTNRLQEVHSKQNGKQQFRYDEPGNPVQWGETQITYDRGLRTVSTLRKGQQTMRYIYGADNRPVMRLCGDSSTIFFYGSGAVPLARWDDGRLRTFVWGAVGLTAVIDDKIHYPICDHSGTTWCVSDAEGKITAEFDYEPFGRIRRREGVDAADWCFMFQGKEYLDEFELYEFGARLYDPGLMRFLNPDPARQFATAYQFVGNNPLVMVDPTGKSSFWTTFAMVAISVAAVAAGIILTVGSAGLLAPAAAPAAGSAAATAVTAAGTAAVATGAAAGTTVLSAAGVIGMNTLGGALLSAGIAGGTYVCSHGKESRDWKEFGIAIGTAAAGGAASGLVSGVSSLAVNAVLNSVKTITGTILGNVGANALTSPTGSLFSTMISNSIEGKGLMRGVVLSVLIGAATGTASGAFGGVSGCCRFELPGDAGFAARAVKSTSEAIKRVKETAIEIAKNNKIITCSTLSITALGVTAITAAEFNR